MKKKIDPKYIAAFCILAGTIIFYFLVKNLGVIFGGIFAFLKVFSPIFYAFVFAYILNPIEKMLEKAFVKSKMTDKSKRVISIVLTYVIALVVVALIVTLVSTQVVQSVKMLIDNSSAYIEDFSEWVAKLEGTIGRLSVNHSAIGTYLKSALKSFENLVSEFTSNIDVIFNGAISFVNSTATIIGYVVLGIILSVYMLFHKEKYIAYIKKALFALLGEKNANIVINFGVEVDDSVGGFFSGKLIGCLIAAVLSYIAFLICRIKFPALLALLIGISDIIPIFGPVIGAIPCAFILLVVAPKQVIPFVICLIIVEQLEGNIISPRILSHTTGVSGFWVLVSLTVGGAFGGVIGMVLAVPFCAVIQKLIMLLFDRLLDKRGLEKSCEYYESLSVKPEGLDNEPPKIVTFFKTKFKRKNGKK